MNYEALSASDGSGEAIRATVQSPGRDIGSSVIPVNAVTNYPSGVGACIITTGTLQANNTIANPQVMYGTAEGTSITITSFAPGYTDIGNSAGDVVVIKPTTEWANIVATHIQNITGYGTPEPVTASTLSATGLITANGGIAGPAFGTWTPSWTNLTAGNGTVNGKYMKIGKGVWWNLSLEFGSTTSMGAGPIFSLPTAIGNTPANDNSFTLGTGGVVIAPEQTVRFAQAQYQSSTTALIVMAYAADTYTELGGITSTSPFVWTENSCIDLSGFYQST